MTYAATVQSSTVPTEYNGWSNRETWVMNLWLTNDMGYHDIVAQVIAGNSPDEQAAELERWVRDDFDWLDMQASLWRDLLVTSLGRVDWQEIIECNR